MTPVTEQATFGLRNRNPDVLKCIANLSNDEIFTPPELANQMLDRLAEAWAESHEGASIWADKSLRFLDPFTKSGVFLREIAARLIDGLQGEIPNLQDRVDHVLTQQLFGISITRLTSLIARRSLYCSKWANGEHSVARSFTNDAGNIWFEPVPHHWVDATDFVETADVSGQPIRKGVNGRCEYCGASQKTLDRADGLETHAYAFIHTNNVTSRLAEMFGDAMQFDVIIGNPPYQLDDGGYGTSAAPIYQKFVDQAKALNPRLLSMIIPARWFAGGKGLDEFRESMLRDDHLRSIDDFLSAADVFPGVGLKGGVCFFLWDRDNPGPCRVTTHYKNTPPSTVTRKLLEPGVDIFIRFNEGLSILKKVIAVETGQAETLSLPEQKRFERLVSSRKPFALDTTFKGRASKVPGDLLVHQNGGLGYIPRNSIATGTELIDKWKIFVGYAAPGTGNKDTYPHRIISTPFIGEPGSICTETYLCIGPFDTENEARNALSYLTCRLTRLLILLHKPSQHVTRKVYTFVPIQEWANKWTDADLYKRYGITDDEIAFIEELVRPMEFDQ